MAQIFVFRVESSLIGGVVSGKKSWARSSVLRKQRPFMPITHSLRRPVESHRALTHRKKTLALAIVLAVGMAAALVLLLEGCGGGSASSAAAPTPSSSVSTLSAADVGNMVQ